MQNKTHNGWSNRQTWLVNLWFNPESKADVQTARDTLEEDYQSLSGIFRDMIDLSVIDWDELESHFDDEESDEDDDSESFYKE